MPPTTTLDPPSPTTVNPETPSRPAGIANADKPGLPAPAIITAMVGVSEKVSDLILSPSRPPQVELNGMLVPVPGLPVLRAADTARIAGELIGNNKRAFETLKNEGACDL